MDTLPPATHRDRPQYPPTHAARQEAGRPSLPADAAHGSTLRHHSANRFRPLAGALLLLSLLLAACDLETSSTPTPTITTATQQPTAQATATRQPNTPPTSGGALATATLAADLDLPVEGLEQALVERVVDGDTLIVWRDGQPDTERLRYIGVDTPESVDPNRPVECYGPEASEGNAALVADDVVWLERDVSDTDQYGRLLRYVYVERDGELVFVNLELIRAGLATTVNFPPDTRYSDVLRAAQNEARAADRGLWGACTP